MWDAKAITGESIAKQHRLILSNMVMWTKWKKTIRPEKRTNWWRLREKEMQNQFREKVLESTIMESEGGTRWLPARSETLQGSYWVLCQEGSGEKTERHGGGVKKCSSC